MSEKEEAFLERIHKIFETALEKDREKRKAQQESQKESSKESSEKHQHWKAEDISDTCPECVAEKDKIGKAYAKKVAEATKNLDYECVECGTHFDKKEKKCPTCGKTTVRRI